jgi:hypothetical protein
MKQEDLDKIREKQKNIIVGRIEPLVNNDISSYAAANAKESERIRIYTQGVDSALSDMAEANGLKYQPIEPEHFG